MYPDPPLSGTHKATPSRWRLRRRSAKPDARSDGLFLQSLDRTIDVSDALNHPLVGLLVTEDLCWRSAVDAWRARKPPCWHWSEWSAWRRDRAILDAKQGRIRDLASDIGIDVAPS